MPASKRSKPLYQRGAFSLHPRAGRNLEIVWYDQERKRERSASAGTTDIEAGKIALDRRFLSESGAHHCPTCHRPWDGQQSPLLADVIADYLLLSEGRAGAKSANGRLAHVIDYLADRSDTRCADVDEAWVARFRKWLLGKPYTKGRADHPRSIGSVEGCVLQLAAAINSVKGQHAAFRATQMKEVARSPSYRADIQTLAAMFRFALEEPHRINLLRYLRLAVATWARPDAIIEARPAQWYSEARVLDLNPINRKQTKKHRPKVPVARQLVPLLDSGEAFLPVSGIRAPWEKMRAALGLPLGREAGEKLVRRSIATLARKGIGEANWRQGEMMLGHVKASVSDIYAIPDPANLGIALAATEGIIDDIEALVPGAYRNLTAPAKSLKLVGCGENG